MPLPPLRSFWHEPPPPAPQVSPWWDRALALSLAIAVVLEASYRGGIEHRLTQALGGLCMVLPLWWRRRHPFPMFSVAFGSAALVPLCAELLGLAWVDLHSTAFILLLLYSLFRWGSGKEACVGLVGLTLLYGLALLRGQFHSVGDAAAGAVVMLFPALLGAAVRQRAKVLQQELDAAKLEERERLARELHDSVAHHVTAIALQAQGGIAVIAQRPEEAARVLHVIEAAAGRALDELRTFVRALRHDTSVSLSPGSQIRDLESLASPGARGLRVDVELRGPLDGVGFPEQAAVYRIAQEAVTNAKRHAQHASQVQVVVQVDARAICVTVTDDGQSRPPRDFKSLGFGLVGMAERAALLGGHFEAGPLPGGGWRVEASLPLEGRTP